MGKYYYIYECKICDRRWGTDRTGEGVPLECEKCHQFAKPIESRPAVHNDYHCPCGSRWRSPRRTRIKCRRCGNQVAPDSDAMKKLREETESSWEYMGEQQKKADAKHAEQTSNNNFTTEWQSLEDERRKLGAEKRKFSEQRQMQHRQHVHNDDVHPDVFRNVDHGDDFEPNQAVNSKCRYPDTGPSRIRRPSTHDENEEQKTQESDYFFNEGNRYYMEANYELAVRSFSEAIELSPGNAAYYKHRSLAFLKLEKVNEAQDDLMRSIQCPHNDSKKPHSSMTEDHVTNLQQSTRNLRLRDRTRHPTELKDSGYQDEHIGACSNVAYKTHDTTDLNVIIMEGLYRNKFRPVKLSELLGVKLDNKTLQSIVHRELPSALLQNNIRTFNPNTGLCCISEIPEICNEEAILCGPNCFEWHICKRFLFGCCPRGPFSCKMNHDFFHQKNSPLLNKNGLYGIDEKIMRALMLCQHRPDCLRPHICRQYSNSQCRKHKCLFLHICLNFMLDNCRCPRSHSLNDVHNKPIIEYFNVSMDGTCTKEEIAERIQMWNPNAKGYNTFDPSRPYETSPSTQTHPSLMTSSTRTEIPPFGGSSSIERHACVTSSSIQETRRLPGQLRSTNSSSYDVRTEMQDPAIRGGYRREEDGNNWDTAKSASTRKPATARSKCSAAMAIAIAKTTAPPTARIAPVTTSAATTLDVAMTADRTTPASARTAVRPAPVWQYNLDNTRWRNFLPKEQLELESALCDAVQEEKGITIEGRAVTVNLNEMASVGIDHATGGVTLRRTCIHDLWTWFYGSNSYGKWTQIVGQGANDTQLRIERSYQMYRAGNSDHKLRIDVKNIGRVELDFEKWIVTDSAHMFLDILRRPAREVP